MRDLNVPEIEDPDRYFPDPVLVERPKARWLDDGRGEIWIDDKETWRTVHPVCMDILDGLEQTDTFDDLVESIPDHPDIRVEKRKAKVKVARKFVWTLAKRDWVRLDLPEPPEIFDGRYRRLRELGRGGLGIVHLCEDLEEDGRELVVKHPWGVKNHITGGQKSLAREVRAMRIFGEHAGIPELYETFTREGLLHAVREFVDGETLSRLSRRGTLADDEELRFDVTRQIAGILHVLHQEGALFSDISPGNFMLREDGQVVAMDVGAVVFGEDGEPRVEGRRGTGGYCAPELTGRWEEDEHWYMGTPRSEVYALGRTYYYFVTGERPSRSWLHADLETDLRERGVDEVDRRVILACCQDDPMDRPQSMPEMIELLPGNDPHEP